MYHCTLLFKPSKEEKYDMYIDTYKYLHNTVCTHHLIPLLGILPNIFSIKLFKEMEIPCFFKTSTEPMSSYPKQTNHPHTKKGWSLEILYLAFLA